MPYQINNIGEEYFAKLDWRADLISRPASVNVGLYNDSTDQLGEGDDLAALTTEPGGTDYQRQSVSIDSSSVTIAKDGNGDYYADLEDVTFQTDDASQTVDSYFISVTFDSDEAGDSGTPTEHLIATGELSSEVNLDIQVSLIVRDVRVTNQ